MELGRREALGLAAVMSRALAVVHGLFLGAVSHAFPFDIRGSALDEGRVKPSPETKAPQGRLCHAPITRLSALPTSVDSVPIRRWILRETPSKTGPTDSDQAAILDMMITRAQGRIDTQLRDAEIRAARSLGVLAIDAAAVALLVGVHTDLSRFWPVPTVALGIAGFGLLWVVWPAKLDSGPDTRAFFETFGGGFELITKQQMLADLLAAVDRNDLDSRLRTRDRIFRWSFILLVVSLIGSLAVAMTGPALQFP